MLSVAARSKDGNHAVLEVALEAVDIPRPCLLVPWGLVASVRLRGPAGSEEGLRAEVDSVVDSVVIVVALVVIVVALVAGAVLGTRVDEAALVARPMEARHQMHPLVLAVHEAVVSAMVGLVTGGTTIEPDIEEAGALTGVETAASQVATVSR